jgi:hypothetical protein
MGRAGPKEGKRERGGGGSLARVKIKEEGKLGWQGRGWSAAQLEKEKEEEKKRKKRKKREKTNKKKRFLCLGNEIKP